MIPARFAPIIFALTVSFIMSAIISGVSTFAALGMAPDLISTWVRAWYSSWIIAFPSLLVVAPIGRRVVGWLTTPPN